MDFFFEYLTWFPELHVVFTLQLISGVGDIAIIGILLYIAHRLIEKLYDQLNAKW